VRGGETADTAYNLAPVTVSFREPMWTQSNPGEVIPLEPSETRSGNLSFYVTSSLPYFEDPGLYPFGRDRPTSLTTTEGLYTDTTTVTFPEESE